MVKRCILLILIALNCATSGAQAPVPLDTPMRMLITARDTDLLAVYNIYSAEVGDGEEKLPVDLLVMKNEDTFSRKSYILGRLTIVKEFHVFPGSTSKRGALHDLEGIEISSPKGLNKQAYLNFDPMLPDPVFLLKMDAKGNAQ